MLYLLKKEWLEPKSLPQGQFSGFKWLLWKATPQSPEGGGKVHKEGKCGEGCAWEWANTGAVGTVSGWRPHKQWRHSSRFPSGRTMGEVAGVMGHRELPFVVSRVGVWWAPSPAKVTWRDAAEWLPGKVQQAMGTGVLRRNFQRSCWEPNQTKKLFRTQSFPLSEVGTHLTYFLNRITVLLNKE